MALTESTMVKLGSKAPYFNLPNVDGKDLSIEDFTNEVLELFNERTKSMKIIITSSK